ncbi:MAG: PaaI family thioesterase [Candidatus Omnitrophota bacterium]
MKKIILKDDNYCFVCGKNNRLGLKLDLRLQTDKTIICEFVAQKEHQGFFNIVHGGIIGLIMDEAMVNLLWKLGVKAVTSEFVMRLKNPAYVGGKLIFTACIEKQAKRVYYTKAVCKNKEGLIIATGTAKCIKVD